MTLLTSTTAARRWRAVREAALVLVALFAAHEAVYLVRGSALGDPASAEAAAGHAYWPAFVAIVAVSLLALGLRTGWRLTFGIRKAAVALDQATPPPGRATFAAEWRQLFGRLAPTVAALFLLQENLEHLLAHGHIEGLAVYLGHGSLLALPAVLAIVAILAAAGALVRWQESALVARLRAARRRHPQPDKQAPAPAWALIAAAVHRQLWLADNLRGRAPPLPTVA